MNPNLFYLLSAQCVNTPQILSVHLCIYFYVLTMNYVSSYSEILFRCIQAIEMIYWTDVFHTYQSSKCCFRLFQM